MPRNYYIYSFVAGTSSLLCNTQLQTSFFKPKISCVPHLSFDEHVKGVSICCSQLWVWHMLVQVVKACDGLCHLTKSMDRIETPLQTLTDTSTIQHFSGNQPHRPKSKTEWNCEPLARLHTWTVPGITLTSFLHIYSWTSAQWMF